MPSSKPTPSATRRWTRRGLLAIGNAVLVALAGCSSPADSPDDDETSRAADTPTDGQSDTTLSKKESESESKKRCVAGERRVGNASISVDGAWSQFQAGSANTGYKADTTGPTDPSLAWRYATCARLAESPPVVADGSVYIGGDSLRAFDASTGEVEWRVQEIESPTAPAVAEDTVYFAGRDLVAVDRVDGTVAWRNERESDILAHDSPTLADGTLYVPGAVDDPTLRAFDAATGERRWSLALEGEFGPGPPAVAGDRVYVTDDGNRLVAVGTDGSDAHILGGGQNDPGIFSPPAVADGTVYVGGLEGRVRAFDAATGERRWSRRLSRSGIPGPPVVADDRLYAVEAGAVHALTTDGQKIWERPIELVQVGLPVLAGETLYVGGYADVQIDASEPTGRLTALDVADGSERWTWTTRGFPADDGNVRAGTAAPVAVADGVVFAATGAGDLFALG